MKKSILIILYILFANGIIYSQVHTEVIRQRTYGGSLADNFIKAVQTSDGGYLVGLNSVSGISGDKTVPSKGGDHIWLIKLNNNLTVQWQKSIGGSDSDNLSDILLLDDGSFLLLATSYSPISLDKTVENFGLSDYWLIEIDSLGNILQQHTYGGDQYNYARKIISINNDYLIAGGSNSDSSGIKTEDSRGGHDFWFLLIDDSYQIIYDKTLGGSSNADIFMDVIYDNSLDYIFLLGTSSSDISGDITNSPYGPFGDYLLFNCNASDGQLISDHRYGGTFYNQAFTIKKLNNSIYIGGNSNSDSSGVKTEDSRDGGQYNDYWVLKLNMDGSIVWDKTIGGNYIDNLYQIETTPDNQIILIGSSSSDITGEKTEARIGQQDYWIVSLDTNSNILWQKTLGGTLTDYAKQIIVLGPNHYIVFGDSKSGISGHKIEPCRGEEDVWILEISTNLSIENFAKNSLKIMPNPAAEYFSFSFTEKSQSGVLYIFNPSGTIVHSEKIDTSKNTIEISHLSNGLYFVSFFDENGIGYSATLVKQ